MEDASCRRLVPYALAVARECTDPWQRSLGPIHIIKYLYLADLQWAREHQGTTWTGIDWRFYLFGPFEEDASELVQDVLAHLDVERIVKDHPKAENQRFEYRLRSEDTRSELEAGIDLPIRLTLRNAVRKYANDTSALLHDVYRTPPMLHAAPDKRLDFGTVVEEPSMGVEVPVVALTDRQRKLRREALSTMRERFTSRLDQEIAARPLGGRAPRYDQVFQDGTRWLDDLAGSPPPEAPGTLSLDASIWRSPTRSERRP